MAQYCDDCGCKMYNGACTNCHEEIYIAEQYSELGWDLPPEETEFTKKLREAEADVARRNSSSNYS